MGNKELILSCLKTNGPLTNGEISEYTGIDVDTVRSTINRMKDKIVDEGHRNGFKLRKLKNKNNGTPSNGIVKSLKQGFENYNELFQELTDKVVKQGRLTKTDYISIINSWGKREFISNINKQLKESENN